MKDNPKIIEVKTSAKNRPIIEEFETNAYGNKPKCTNTLNEKYLKLKKISNNKSEIVQQPILQYFTNSKLMLWDQTKVWSTLKKRDYS